MSSHLELEGTHIVLREFTEENLRDPRYISWLRDLEVVGAINRTEYLVPIKFKKIEQYVHNLFESKSDAFFAIYHADDDAFIGTLRILNIDWHARTAEIGILIGDKNYWGKGLAKDAVSTACKYAFSTLSMHKLSASNLATNIAMCKCFERLGFQKEARLRKHNLVNGEYVDRIAYGLFRDEFQPYE